MIQTASQNHLGGTDYVTNTYSFVGDLLTSKREHKASPTANTLTILTTNDYDHMSRLVETKKKINQEPEIVQSKNSYNEIGQLMRKDLHVSGSTAIQQQVYRYNERGWLTGINDPQTIDDSRRFGMTLHYANKPDAFNGNIGSVSWNTKVSDLQTQTPVQTYTYDYDKLNRLKLAAYSDASSTRDGFYNEELTYDDMGNIKSLQRTSGSLGLYNDFTYSYTGNQLMGVTDVGTASRSNSFSYNANGSTITNSRLGITDIAYNYLNLPKRFEKGTQELLFNYDATGRKVRKELGTSVTDYVGGIQYRDGELEFIQTEEGRIIPIPNSSSLVYEYFLTDHLGNTRVIVDHTGAVKQITDYYAFGMEMNQGNALNAASNLYKYNGKELQPELGLEQYDYGARFYDAEIGRWNAVDRMADVYSSYTPYNYVVNNPLLFIDPNGMWVSTSDGYYTDDPNDFGSFLDFLQNNGSGSSMESISNFIENSDNYSIGLDPVYVTLKGFYDGDWVSEAQDQVEYYGSRLGDQSILSRTHRKSKEILNVATPSPIRILQDELSMSIFTDVKILKSKNPFFNVNLVYDEKGKKLQVAGVSVLGGLYGVSLSSSGVVSQSTKIGALNMSLGFGINKEGVTISGRTSFDTGTNSASGVSVNYKMGAVGYTTLGAIISRGTSIPYSLPALRYAF